MFQKYDRLVLICLIGHIDFFVFARVLAPAGAKQTHRPVFDKRRYSCRLKQ